VNLEFSSEIDVIRVCRPSGRPIIITLHSCITNI